MDVTSIEFYTLAFVVAMALVGFLIGSFEKDPPSTYILQLSTSPSQETPDDADTLFIEYLDEGKFLFKREGLTLAPEETVNLVMTVRGDECTIVEKKGKRRRGVAGEPVSGVATVKCLRYGRKYKVRYESQLTSTWASFSLDTTDPKDKLITLTY